MMIPGIDVSHWQADIDWVKVAQSGVKFAFIKATEFPDRKLTVYVDDHLKKNVTGASQNGILWGAYHYFRTHIDPTVQARTFCATVGQFSSLPPVMDLEVAGCNGTKLNEKVIAFLKEVQSITSRQPIIYTSGGFWRSYMMYNRRVDTDWARGYPLWLAQYTTAWPGLIYPWAGWDFWQYTSQGRLPGIATGVDLNWYIGSLEEMKQKYLNNNKSKLFENADDLINMQIEKDPSELDTLQPVESKTKNQDVEADDESEDDWIKRYFFNR